MATSTIKPVHAGIDVPYDLPTSSSSWTETSGKYVHTYTDSRITQGCRVEVTFKAGTFNTELSYLEFEKGTGSVDFIVSAIPTVAVPVVIHIINAQTGNVQAVSATDVATSGDAQTIGANVNSALISLNDEIAKETTSEAVTAVAATGVTLQNYNSFRKKGNIIIGTLDLTVGSSDIAAWSTVAKVQVGTEYPHCSGPYNMACWNVTDSKLEPKRVNIAYTGDLANGYVSIQVGDALVKNKRYMIGPIIGILCDV